jgi:hypothetical protein
MVVAECLRNIGADYFSGTKSREESTYCENIKIYLFKKEYLKY